MRRDRWALHEAIRLDGEAPDGPDARKRASDLGLIAGDLLFALGMRTLSHSGLDEHVLARAQRAIAGSVSGPGGSAGRVRALGLGADRGRPAVRARDADPEPFRPG